VGQDDIIWLIVIEESANDAEVILNSLRKARYSMRPRHIEDAEELQESLTEHEWDLIISVPKVGNEDIGEFTLGEVCEMVKASKQDIPVIGIIDENDGNVMAELLNEGAVQVVPREPAACLQVIIGREYNNLVERRKRKHTEQLYKESQRHNKTLLESSRDAIAYVHDGMHIYANPSYLEMFGYKSMEELEGMPIMDLVAIDDQAKFKEFMRQYMQENTQEEEQQIDLEGLKSSNKRFKLKMEFSQAIYDSERCIQAIIRDQSQSQELEKKIKDLSRRDQVTGLFNRQYFLSLLEKSLAKAIESHTRSTLFYIALDDFSSVKEKVGVGATDPVIPNIAKKLKDIMPKDAIFARFGDSVFTLLLSEKDIKLAEKLAAKICKTVEDTVTETEDQSTILATCSIGLAPVLATANSVQAVLADAHSACRSVAERGGNNFEAYKAKVKTEQGDVKIDDIAKMIETAIDDNRLSLRFQPIVSLRGDTQAIYEVFLRMVDTEGKLVPTNALFEAAEKANLTIQLDKWVLKEALKVLMQKAKEGQELYFFIKLSDQAIRDETVLLYIRKLLKSTQLPGERLIFELSESTVISQVKAAKAFVTSLRTVNCQAALEHFGTGLNSVTTIKHVPVDFVKIDASFCRDLSSNEDNQKSVNEFVKLAHEHDKAIIAEGVEDANSLSVLWSSDVDFAQGHYVQEPLEELAYDFEEEG